MSKNKLNDVDLAWLRMENPYNPMMIMVVLQLRGQINYERLVTDLKDTLNRYRPFRQRIVRPRQIFSRPYWEDDPEYQIENHVERLEFQSPVNDVAVDKIVNGKLNTPLDFSRPLWNITLVDNHPDGSILIVRIHHCIADGISLMQVLLQMTENSSEGPVNQAPGANPNHVEQQVQGEATIGHTKQPAFSRGEVSAIISNTKSKEQTPQPGRGILERKPTIGEISTAIARIIFRAPDPATIFKKPLGKIKKAIWSKPFSLPEIKEVAKFHQTTINDLLMAIATGAIQRYIGQYSKKPKRNIRAFVMVNLRGSSIDGELGNKFGIVFLKLPLDRELPLDRLQQIKQNMDSLKASAEYAASYLILNILGKIPQWIQSLATRILDTKGTVVSTNLIGPRHPIYLAGAPILSIKAAVPQSGRIGVGLSFVSYNNQVVVGLNADAGLIPDPENFLELFADEFKSFQAIGR